MLDELLRDGRIPHVPLYLDSPMASRASDVYLRHPEVYDEETAALLRSGDSPLVYPGEQYTNSGRRVEGDPRPATPDHGRRQLRHADRRPDHAPPQGLPPRSGLHAAVHRLPGGGHAGTPPADRRQDGAHRPRRIRRAVQGRLDLRLLGPCRRQRADGLAGALRRISRWSRCLRSRCLRTDDTERGRSGSSWSTATPTPRRHSPSALRRELGLDVHIPSYREVVTLR